MANVANNIGDALRSRRDLPIGFVPWAINFYISFAVIIQFASVAGVGADWSSFSTALVITLCLMILPYVTVSRMLYPEHKDRWASIEDYYIANRKLILGVMLVSPVSYAVGLIFYTPELVAKGPILLFVTLPSTTLSSTTTPFCVATTLALGTSVMRIPGTVSTRA